MTRDMKSAFQHFLRPLGIAAMTFILGFGISHSSISQHHEKALLWKIEGQDIKTSYVFGTFHLLPKENLVISEELKHALRETQVFVGELDMDDPNMQAQIMQNALMADGTTVDQLLTEAEYAKLDSIVLSSIGVPLEAVKGWKPLLIASLILGNYIEGDPASYEASLLQLAMTNEMEIIGLETPAEQLAIFDEIPYKEQVEDIKELINEEAESRRLFSEMLEIYAEQDVEALHKVIEENTETERQVELILDDRNRKWLPEIIKIAAEKPSFFAVGSGHLGGKDGVISLLEQKGYKLTPVI